MGDRVLVTLDLEVRDADEPFLHADDSGSVRGDGVFETLLVREGRALQTEAHLTRLVSSARSLGLPAPELDEWRLAIELAVEQWEKSHGDREGAMRLVLSRGRESGGGPTSYVTVAPLPDRVEEARAGGVSVMTLERGYSVDLSARAPWLLLGAKTLSYATNMAALRYAAAHGADDVIFLSSEGRVLEGPRSSVVIVRGKTLITPPVEQGILAGTTQKALFEVAVSEGYQFQYTPLRTADLITAEGVWLVSSVTLAARVRKLNGLPLGKPLFEDEFRALVDLAVERGGSR
ncbi:MAG: aminodeoxychorismate lyase [Rhodococcus sp.]|nr:aminodeoxychorismate lyase [Rhodococcus sp. (in: high G+C Gram-positive bacteria)]